MCRSKFISSKVEQKENIGESRMAQKAVVFAIVALIIGLVIGAGATYLTTGGAPTTITTTVTETVGGAAATTTATMTTTLTTTTTVTATPAAGLPEKIVIGVVLPLSGDLASEGKLVSNALTLAEEDINNYLATLGLSTKIEFDIEDSKTTPEGGLQAVQSLAARGVTCIIGPMISPAISASKDYVDSHHIVLLSQSSTAMSLAISDDFVFRLYFDLISPVTQIEFNDLFYNGWDFYGSGEYVVAPYRIGIGTGFAF